jgi:hypothetical protein
MNATRTIPRLLQEKVHAELESGERICWLCAPTPRFFTRVSTGAFLFGIPWTAFAVFWTCCAVGFCLPDLSEGIEGSDFFPLFGVPFILIGLGMFSSPLWAYRKALNTVYVITDRRAISIDGGWSTTIRSHNPSGLKEVFRRERKNGLGDVVIAGRAWRDSDGDRQLQEIGFLNIRDPKSVEQMLKDLAETGNPAGET